MNKPNTELLAALSNPIPPASAEAPDFIPETAPFTEEQRAFLNGLFTGVEAVARKGGGSGAGAEQAQTPLQVYFGSQTGTAESLSKDLRKFARTRGFDAAISELDTITPTDLLTCEHLLIVAATYGEGEPTDNAKSFYDALMADDAPALPATLNFSVCGLGDSSYPNFNQVAQELDARLEALGATRCTALVTCDVDYDDDFATWRGEVFASEAFLSAAGDAVAAPAGAEDPSPAFDKNHPFVATLIRSERLSGCDSVKCVNHVEIALTGGGEDMRYEAGDALGVWPLNDMAEVDGILETTGLTGNEIVQLKTGPTRLRQALFRSLDLMTVTQKTAEAWNVTVAEDDQLIDLLPQGVAELDAQVLVDGLRPLQPRLYSISSSPNKHPGEVHLTVGEVHYELNGSARKGVASTFLGGRLPANGSLGVYVQRSPHFALPADDAQPLIMIGPGTGIAPFRAFLEERETRGAPGPNWLFFGDQHESSDYIYRDQITAWKDSGLLTRLSLAWSRDSEQKVYVQHRIREAGAEFFQWLQNGAAIYICGDALRMAVDVEGALLDVIGEHGGMDREGAEAYLESLRKTHRYQRDVY